ncbi:DUF3325 domain-containing protein [Roseomonas indoligenes]|uniref:DUF3325 domain-containing protein n=1 Tax=Roseomonas indoligenes TaxID=2820811 RepID=A0A940S5Z7_9PROT|nr:DUF3325 domain-containing protein [Pararoseomonas indoligenes]MBP0494966.1 DUF3325 domain-containing protein [Pararoseomonas indoligenes]
MTTLALALAYAGFTGLCLAMERHHEQVFGTRRVPPMRGSLFRGAGWLLLVISLLVSVLGAGPVLGILLWAGLLTAAALLLALLLAFTPRAAAAVALSPFPVALLLML